MAAFNMPRTLACLLILVSISLIGLSNAQEQKKQQGEQQGEEVKGTSFTAISLSSLPYENIYYRKGKEFIKIEWRNGRRSIAYALDEAKPFEVFTDHEDPKNPYLLIGKASLVSGTRKMLYFFRENGSAKEGALPLSLYGIDDSETIFPDSSYRFINFVNVPLVVDFDQKKRFLIKPGKPIVHKLNLSKAGAFTPFVLRDTKGKVLGGTRLFSHATNREMVLIFPPKKGKKRMDIRFFSD